MNEVKWVAAVFLTVSPALAAPNVYDPFNYTIGANLDGLSPATGFTWFKGTNGATATVDATIDSENLSYSGLAASTGNSVLLTNSSSSTAVVDRIAVKTPIPPVVNTGTLYYSLLLKVRDIGNLANATPTGGAFIAGFNNSVAANTSTNLSRAGARLQFGKDLSDATKFNIGVRTDNDAANPSTITWGTQKFTPGLSSDTIFVVVGYTFVSGGTTNDIASIWVNPDPSTFEAASAPTYTSAAGDTYPLTSTGSDISEPGGLSISSFFLRQNTVAPAATVVDEVRIGASWADVTPSSLIRGACCVKTGFGTGTCSFITPDACSAIANSTYNGDGTSCGANNANCGDFCPNPRFDADQDGDVDANDFGFFQQCFGLPATTPGCHCFDKSGNGTIDAPDFFAFTVCAGVGGSGAGVPANPSCDD